MSEINKIYQIAFLPWLRLVKPYCIAGVNFVPLGNDPDSALKDVIIPLSKILSGFINREGQPIENCVIITISSKGWDLSDSDYETVQWATSLLFLAAWSSNHYYSRFNPYANSSSFRVVWQRFKETPDFLTLISRRRDGTVHMDGGYSHGEIKFNLPLQCSLKKPVTVDESLLLALDKGIAAGSETVERLRSATSFVELANSDENYMSDSAAVILMVSAFDQLFGGTGIAKLLGQEFGKLFSDYGRKKVEDAKKIRLDINLSNSSIKEAQWLKWFIHQEWMREFFQLRNKYVHEGIISRYRWGWTPIEHLVMSAWVFPLAIKLLLQQESYYELSEADEKRCIVVDKLLSIMNWNQNWTSIISDNEYDYINEKIIQSSLPPASGLRPPA